MKLWRMDGGQFHITLNVLSDTLDYPEQARTLTNSCYLIQHGSDLLLFDTGFATALEGPLDPAKGVTAMGGVPLIDQLAELGFTPSDVTILALSHYHSDHTGQAVNFPRARLLLGRQDIDALLGEFAPFYSDPDHVRHWLTGAGELDHVMGDLDVFGDGKVVMLALPGHTPGHHGLLVRLDQTGPVILCADTVHFAAQLAGRVPSFNTSRAESLASIERILGLVANLNATLIASHDPDDVKKLPVFPAFAH